MFRIIDYNYLQATGEDYTVEVADTRRPFRALLDVGLLRTTTGNRVFGALKVDFCFNWDNIYLALFKFISFSCKYY